MDQEGPISLEQSPAPIISEAPSSGSSKKPSKIPLIILGILAFVAVGVSAFYLGKKSSGPKMTTPTAVPNIPEPTSTPDPMAGWETYTNTKYGFEIRYYPELVPNEQEGNKEVNYLQSILFGTGLGGGNYLKSKYGFGVKIRNKSTLGDLRAEIIKQGVSKIDSEEEVVFNSNKWKKINYKIFITTDYTPATSAITGNEKYNYEIIASAVDIDQILSTFKFLYPSEASEWKTFKNENRLAAVRYSLRYPEGWKVDHEEGPRGGEEDQTRDLVSLTKGDYKITIFQSLVTMGGDQICQYSDSGKINDSTLTTYGNFEELNLNGKLVRRAKPISSNQPTAPNYNWYYFCEKKNIGYSSATSYGEILYQVPEEVPLAVLNEMDSILKTIQKI